MKDLKTVLSSAIETNNMELVRDFYLRFFGEEPPLLNTEVENSSFINRIKTELENILNLFTQEKTSLKSISIEKKTPTNELQQQFISSEDYELPEDSDPNYKVKAKKLSQRKKQIRNAYVANMKKCDYCDNLFDFNKEYPAGVVQNDKEIKIKCHSCKRK